MDIRRETELLLLLTICVIAGVAAADIAKPVNETKANNASATAASALPNKTSVVPNIAIPEAKVLQEKAATAAPANSTKRKCVCNGVLVQGLQANGQQADICPECKCQHEARNTTLIKVVVIFVIWVISILVIYMLFLMCLDPLLNKRVKTNYQEHTNEDDDISSISTPMPSTSSQDPNSRNNVLNRVGHQTDKWKRQVREQRRHIYDRRTMLN